MIALAPALMISQTGSASEPWDNPWVEEWPSLLDRPIATDREMAALQQRIDRAGAELAQRVAWRAGTALGTRDDAEDVPIPASVPDVSVTPPRYSAATNRN